MRHIQQTLLIRLISLVLLLISLITATAQTGKSITKCYLQASAGGGSSNSNYSDLSLQAILKNKWSLSLSYQTLDMRPNNIPGDYKPATGEGAILFIPYSYTNGVDNINMNLVNLTGGKYFKTGRNTWATTEIGVSLVKGEKVDFNPVSVRSGSSYYFIGWEDYTTSNYETTVANKTTVGATVKADLNWAVASFFGIGAGVFANLNSIQSPVGFHVKLMVGFMGREKRNKR